jgi:hypothetical protein
VFLLKFNCKSMGFLELEAILVPKASSWHKSRVFGLAHKVHSQCIAVKELGIAETLARHWQDSRGQDHGVKLSSAENSCSSN